MSSRWQSFKSSLLRELQMTPISAPACTKKVRFEVAGRTSSSAKDVEQKGLGISLNAKSPMPTTTKSEYKGILITSKSEPDFFDEIIRAAVSNTTFFTILAMMLVWATAGMVYGTADTSRLLFRVMILYKSVSQAIDCFDIRETQELESDSY